WSRSGFEKDGAMCGATRDAGEMQLRPLLRAHGFLQVNYPPQLWDVDAEDTTLVPMLGEMIAAALARGNELGSIELTAGNVTVEPEDWLDAQPIIAAPGDYVAITIGGTGDWTPEMIWHPTPTGAPTLINADLDAAARRAGVVVAYIRQMDDRGTVTVF